MLLTLSLVSTPSQSATGGFRSECAMERPMGTKLNATVSEELSAVPGKCQQRAFLVNLTPKTPISVKHG
jgi:hypothetical protein